MAACSLSGPQRWSPVEPFAQLDRGDLALRFVAETHLHADFVSGGRELAARGAQLLAPAGSKLAYDYRVLENGQEVDLGALTLRVLATPGHTPEHLAYLLLDGARPVALFSGGRCWLGGRAHRPALPRRHRAARTSRLPVDHDPVADVAR
jgi:hydroxyacylglutathione hydrolase